MQNNTDFHIRPLSVHDISAAEDLARVMIAAWRSGFRDILPDSVIETYTQFEPCADMFRQIIASGVGSMYLAQLNAQSVGLLYLLPEGETARIEALLTVPAVWGKGVAAALLEQAIADSACLASVHVWPFAENLRARRFYEKHGFLPTGKTRMGDAKELEYVRLHL